MKYLLQLTLKSMYFTLSQKKLQQLKIANLMTIRIVKTDLNKIYLHVQVSKYLCSQLFRIISNDFVGLNPAVQYLKVLFQKQ